MNETRLDTNHKEESLPTGERPGDVFASVMSEALHLQGEARWGELTPEESRRLEILNGYLHWVLNGKKQSDD